MNKTNIKNFAIWARNKLRSEITYKAGLLGINEKEIVEPLPQSTDDLQIFDIGTSQPVKLEGKTAVEQRKALVNAIKAKRLPYSEAFDTVIEEVAYTWFNRLIAVRFMEVNEYLPSRVRVLSSENPDKAEPDFVTKPYDTDLEFTGEELDYIDECKDKSRLDELFQFLFIKQCNKLHDILPELFEQTNDYTELLLNVSFTDKDGIVWHLVHDIDEEDFNIEKEGQVEIIGWLYQYYNTEPKVKVFSRPSGQKIRKEDVPAATQLFTPDWIVRYMVENSLGRLWIDRLKANNKGITFPMTFPVSFRDTQPEIDSLKKEWKYYLDEAEQTKEVQLTLAGIRKGKKDIAPENICFLDPCMGSGHILVYAFDVLMDIYRVQGYTDRDAVQKIVQNNLYGLELDDRAAQLAYFAVMMKARSYDRRFLTRGIRPNLCSIKESNIINPDYLELFGELKDTARKLYDEFIDAKEYGSILNLKITADEISQLEEKCNAIIDNDTVYDNIFDTIRQVGIRTDFPALLRQAKIMVNKYDVVCTNPPYMGSSGFSGKLSEFVKKQYPDSKSDMSTIFMEKCIDMCDTNGFVSMINIPVWMFLSSYEKLRENIIRNNTFINMVHPGRGIFGSDFGTTTFTIGKKHIDGYLGSYRRLFEKQVEVKSNDIRERTFLSGKGAYTANQENFCKIPGSPVAYWVSKQFISAFEVGKMLGEYVPVKKGMDTGDNNYFLKLWFEVSNNLIDLFNHSKKWIPYDKGGDFRRWYGNNDYILNWENDGEKLKNSKANLRSKHLYFISSITWSALSVSNTSFRYSQYCGAFDSAGSSMFPPQESIYIFLGLMNSCVSQYYLNVINPTINYGAGSMAQVPVIFSKVQSVNETINTLVEENIQLSKADWDSFETSWDFEKHPLVVFKTKTGFVPISSYSIRDTYMAWESLAETRWMALKANEEELNRIFIDIYGLQDELTPEVEDKDVTVRKADLTREIKSLISYAVGCMFGRYSFDRDGLVFAGGDFDKTYWRFKGQAPLDDNGNPLGVYAGISLAKYHYPRFRDSDSWENATQLLFEPDADNCIPITDTKYFEDDIVGRFCEFIKVVYGEDTLEENLYFIAQALGNKGNSSREVIRNYFLNDFFKDHCKIYQKRPIYWLFDSGKQNGFKALIYMHRYNADTIGNLRVEYLHRVQHIYESEIQREQDNIENSRNSRDAAASTKRKEKLQKQLKETKEYDAKIAHLALSRIEIDLDDGVKVNYEKVQTGRARKKIDVLRKI